MNLQCKSVSRVQHRVRSPFMVSGRNGHLQHLKDAREPPMMQVCWSQSKRSFCRSGCPAPRMEATMINSGAMSGQSMELAQGWTSSPSSSRPCPSMTNTFLSAQMQKHARFASQRHWTLRCNAQTLLLALAHRQAHRHRRQRHQHHRHQHQITYSAKQDHVGRPARRIPIVRSLQIACVARNRDFAPI